MTTKEDIIELRNRVIAGDKLLTIDFAHYFSSVTSAMLAYKAYTGSSDSAFDFIKRELPGCTTIELSLFDDAWTAELFHNGRTNTSEHSHGRSLLMIALIEIIDNLSMKEQ